MEVLPMRLRILLTVLGLGALAVAGARRCRAVSRARASQCRRRRLRVRNARTTVKGGVVAMRFRNEGEGAARVRLRANRRGHTRSHGGRDGCSRRARSARGCTTSAAPGLLTPGLPDRDHADARARDVLLPLRDPERQGCLVTSSSGMLRSFTVSARRSGRALPMADAVITASKKRYVVPPLKAGLQTIELRNRAGAGSWVSSSSP